MALHFLPGMGADRRIWGRIAEVFPDGRFHDWHRPTSLSMSVSAYAQEFARKHGIGSGDTIVGVSMGAIVGAELTRFIPDLRVIQISGCCQVSQLNQMAAFVAPLAHVFPFRLLQFAPSEVLAGNAYRLASVMYRASDKIFIRWACIEIPRWGGIDPAAVAYSIHGDADLVFPVRRAQVDAVIRGGSHLMILTHVDEICSLLITQIEGPVSTATAHGS